MKKIFEGFDFSTFWENSDYTLKEYVGDLPNDEFIEEIETELGYKLPGSYIEMIKIQNGGIPVNTCFPCSEPTCWAEDHIAISGIDRKKRYSLCGYFGSAFWIEEWEYPEIGICICGCPSGGHDMVMLDYRKNGKNGEPEVVHVDQEDDFKITFLAKDFETFIRGLVNDQVYDTSAEDLKKELEMLENEPFSNLLEGFFGQEKMLDFGKALRNLLIELAQEKGYFALHSDELSYLVYDIQFYLYSKNQKINSEEAYLKIYPDMLAMSKEGISTHGYAPDFVKDWLKKRISDKQITQSIFGELKMDQAFEKEVLGKLKEYEK